MGRPRKPNSAKTRHSTKEEIELSQVVEESVVTSADELEIIPTWLKNKTAEKEYKRLLNNFKEINIIGNLDLNNLVIYCNLYADIRAIENAAKKLSMTRKDDKGILRVNAEYERISYQKLKYMDSLRKYADTLGLTVSSRLKAGTQKVNNEQENINDKFGDI